VYTYLEVVLLLTVVRILLSDVVSLITRGRRTLVGTRAVRWAPARTSLREVSAASSLAASASLERETC
jgi:hypothetical protein